jgi:parallel beta-helix repeat protein
VYYVQFSQPKEYRVHDLEWGYLMNCQLGEALQSGKDAYTLKFEDQGVGCLNPDFRYGVGFGFFITNNFVLNGPFIFDGAVDYIRMEGNTTGVCDIRIQGAGENRRASRLTLSHNQFNSVLIGDYVTQIKVEGSESGGTIRVDAPNSADFISIMDNTLIAPGANAVNISGKVRNLRIQDNDIRLSGSDGIVVSGATDGIISGNNTSGCAGKGIVLRDCEGVLVKDNVPGQDGE